MHRDLVQFLIAQPVEAAVDLLGGHAQLGQPLANHLVFQHGAHGLQIGGAQVSEKHCNFLINTGTATAHEIETLGEEVRRRVFATTGVRLEWEIKRIGEFAAAQKTITAGVSA